MLYQNMYVIDPARKREYHAQNLNFPDAYFPELFDALGTRAGKLSVQFDAEDLAGVKCLFAGCCDLSHQARTLTGFVSNGGCLILFATEGVSALSGSYVEEVIAQEADKFAVSGNLLTENFFPNLNPDEPLPVISDLQVLRCANDVKALAQIETNGRTIPGLTVRSLGKGFIYYFPFSLLQTIWYIQQGRPVNGDYDGDEMWRTVDGVTAYGDTAPFTDIYRSMLLSMMEQAGPQPYLYELPVINSRIPDYAIFIPGDDEGASDVQLPAAAHMHEKKLPYHINIMPNEAKDGFNIPSEMIAQLKELGTTPSLHFNFFCQNQKPFEREDVIHQALLYRKYFGETPCVTCNHCLMFTGWADHARWASECGIMGSTDRPAGKKGLVNPINSYGISSGTTLPYYYYDDAIHDNSKINFTAVPSSLYEPRIYEETAEEDKRRIQFSVEEAKQRGIALSVFIHPLYLSQVDVAAAKAAVDYLSELIADDDVWRTTPDDLCKWWFDRSSIGMRSLSDNEYATNAARGFVIKLDPSCTLYIDGEKAAPEQRTLSGKVWNLYTIAAGEHTIRISL